MEVRTGNNDALPEDEYRHKGMRETLIKSLRMKGITDETVLQAMMNVPRHYFFDKAFENIAYEDRAFPIEANQTISQPYTVAFQSQLLEVKPHDKILEVGTGSAYQASVLAEMGARVFTMERQPELFKKHDKNFILRHKYPPAKIKFFLSDGFNGLPTFAPFDKIIITCGAPFIPPKLIEQLKPGGMMVVPVAEDEHHKMVRVKKDAAGNLTEELFNDFSFVPMLPGVQKNQ